MARDKRPVFTPPKEESANTGSRHLEVPVRNMSEVDFYRIIADNTSDMERWISPEKKLVYISPSCEQITGYSVEEYMNDPGLLVGIIHEDDKSWFLQQRDRLFAGEEADPRDFRIITKKGELRWISVNIKKVSGPDGSDLGFRTSYRDVTDKKHLEIQIETERKRYLQILDIQTDLIILCLPDSTLTYVNDTYARFVNRKKEELTGIPWLSFIPEPEVERSRRFLESFAPEECLKTFENYYTGRQGEKHWFEWVTHGFFSQDGTLKEFLFVGHEITFQKLLTEKLRISESFYKSVSEDQADFIVRHTPQGTTTFINNAFLSQLGLSKEEVIGKNWNEWIPAVHIPQVEQLHAKLTPKTPEARGILHFTNSDGSIKHVEFINQGIFNNDGQVIGIQATGRDISRLKETEIRLEQALSEVHDLKKKLEEENKYLRDKVIRAKTHEGLISNSKIMQEILEMAQEVSGTDSPVLLTGETGTGKEVLGNYIHNLSRRRKKMMITVNCGALPPSLIESELFGREKGAYTGALSRQIGRFELAHQSTIFLDEIGELPLDLQVKLLRVIQSGEFQMLGSPETRKVDVRIIAATNRNLEKEVEKGNFRKDLFYRLNVFPIELPPLRERKEDLPMLAWGFIDEISPRMGKNIEKISNSSMIRMLNYHWPGNIRELRNILEYSIILCKSHILEVRVPDNDSPVAETSDNFDLTQRHHIEKVLNQTGWRVRGAGGAAEILGMNESTLRARMKKLGIERNK